MMAGGRSFRMDGCKDSGFRRKFWLEKQNMDFNGISFSIIPIIFTQTSSPFANGRNGPLLAAQLCHQHVPPCNWSHPNRPESPRKTTPKWWKEDMLELVLEGTEWMFLYEANAFNNWKELKRQALGNDSGNPYFQVPFNCRGQCLETPHLIHGVESGTRWDKDIDITHMSWFSIKKGSFI